MREMIALHALPPTSESDASKYNNFKIITVETRSIRFRMRFSRYIVICRQTLGYCGCWTFTVLRQ